MRLPLAIPLDARTGSATKDARLTNTVVENYQGLSIVAPRPALSEIQSQTGTGSGVVCFNGTLISLAGTTAYKATSLSNGGTWVSRTPSETNAWRGVAYGAGLFVAVSSDGTNRVMTSPDGVTWTARSAAEANAWQSVTFGNGLFVAVSSTGTNRVMTSPDGITWTPQTCPAVAWTSVTFGNDIFVASSSNSVTPLMSSPDGITWTTRTYDDGAFTTSFQKVAYGDGIFVGTDSGASGHLLYSYNGIDWVFVEEGTGIPIGWNSVNYCKDKFIIFSSGDQRCITSSDGLTWTEKTVPASSWATVEYGNGLFVALSFAGAVMTSEDAETWTLLTGTIAGTWRDIQFNSGVFVAVSSAGVNRAATTGVEFISVGTIAAGQYDFAQSIE